MKKLIEIFPKSNLLCECSEFIFCCVCEFKYIRMSEFECV